MVRATRRIELGEGAGVWFGCRLEGKCARVVVSADANLQDNGVLRSGVAAGVIGASSTPCHDELLDACSLSAWVPLGMGSACTFATAQESP